MSFARTSELPCSGANDLVAAGNVLLVACGSTVQARSSSGCIQRFFRARHSTVLRIRYLAWADCIVTVEGEGGCSFLCAYRNWRCDSAAFQGHDVLLGSEPTAFATCDTSNTIITSNEHGGVDLWTCAEDGLVHLLEVDLSGIIADVEHLEVHRLTILCGNAHEVRLVQLDHLFGEEPFESASNSSAALSLTTCTCTFDGTAHMFSNIERV